MVLIVQDLFQPNSSLELKLGEGFIDGIWATEAGLTIEIVADWHNKGVATVLDVHEAPDEGILNMPQCAYFMHQRIRHVLEIRFREAHLR